jgi:hypothetical protein
MWFLGYEGPAHNIISKYVHVYVVRSAVCSVIKVPQKPEWALSASACITYTAGIII